MYSDADLRDVSELSSIVEGFVLAAVLIGAILGVMAWGEHHKQNSITEISNSLPWECMGSVIARMEQKPALGAFPYIAMIDLSRRICADGGDGYSVRNQVDALESELHAYLGVPPETMVHRINIGDVLGFDPTLQTAVYEQFSQLRVVIFMRGGFYEVSGRRGSRNFGEATLEQATTYYLNGMRLKKINKNTPYPQQRGG